MDEVQTVHWQSILIDSFKSYSWMMSHGLLHGNIVLNLRQMAICFQRVWDQMQQDVQRHCVPNEATKLRLKDAQSLPVQKTLRETLEHG